MESEAYGSPQGWGSTIGVTVLALLGTFAHVSAFEINKSSKYGVHAT